ncbi:IclR family transcriptional regulator [Pseudonocardia sp. CA-107938]|uniref:IclR family transcriptional regulator n=1 Tax=Pseudonocardia sp. CA-107938 TaxID=3240021 RepID=UPI003D8DAC4D
MATSMRRALRVLEVVGAAGDGVTAKAIARRLACPLPTVYRALAVLVEEGYLVRLDGLRGYGIGYRVAELQRSLTDQLRPPAPVVAALHDLHVEAAAAAYLTVFRDREVVVAHADACAEHPLPPDVRVGEPIAAHAAAAGKVLLATVRPAQVEELLAPHTVPDRRALDRDLMRVRLDGVAVEVEELAAGVAGVAAPLQGPDGEVTGALGVSVSRTEFGARRWELERLVRAAAERAGAGRTALTNPERREAFPARG